MAEAAEQRVRYFAIAGLTGAADDPNGMFREISAPGDYRLERIDPATGLWVSDAEGLAPYIFDGQVGAVEIPVAEAQRLEREFFSPVLRKEKA